jgi:alkylhydroperoxidase family enzyme
VRFAVARDEGLDEEHAGLVEEGYADSALSDRHKLAVRFTDAVLAADGPADPELVADMRSEFDDAEIAELAMGVALFHGFSKLLITFGLEPEEMATIVKRTPDVPS